MGRFGQSIIYGALFAFWIMCFYFGIGVMAALVNGEDVVAFAVQSIGVGFVLWAFCSYAAYELNGWIEERNKPRASDDHQNPNDRHIDRR
jgi:uncharacterized membrane protein